MRTAAIYARYSTDEQSPTSIEDQVRQCRKLAAEKGFEVEDQWVFSDAAISGGTKGSAKRAAFTQVLDAAEAREIDVLFADEVSRVARNQLDGAKICDLVERTGLRIVTGDGIDSQADRNWQFLWAFKLMVAVQQNQSTATEVIRGMLGQLGRGYMIAKAPFGYVPERITGPDGRRLGTLWKPDEAKAAIVVNMYGWRYEGQSLLKIAKRLNNENIPSPGQSRRKTPTYWRPATVVQTLGNTAYKGVFVWNGSSHTKAIAKRRRETVVTVPFDRPELRLVSDEVWAACNPSEGTERIRGGGKHALSGVVRCGHCNAKLSIGGNKKSLTAYCPQCAQAKSVNEGTDFVGYTSVKAVQSALRWGLEQAFTGPAQAEFHERLRARLTLGPAQELAEVEKKLLELTATMNRLKRLVADPRTPEEWLREQLVEAGGEMEAKQRQLKALKERSRLITREVVELQAGLDPLPYLIRLLDGEPAAFKVRAVLQRLITRFRFVGKKRRGHSEFELEFKPGVLVAELSETALVDATRIAFRIEVVTTSKDWGTWNVTGRAI